MEQARTHPILLASGVAVLLFSLLGVAALTGVLPTGNSKQGEPGSLAQQPPAVAAAPAPTTGPAPAARPAQRAAAGVAACATCGRIESIRAVEVKGESSGVGAVAGGGAGRGGRNPVRPGREKPARYPCR